MVLLYAQSPPLPPQTAKKKRLALKRRFCIRTLLHIPVTHYCFSLACRWSGGAPLWVGVRGRSVRWWRPNPFSWSVPTHPLNYAHTQNSVSQNYSDSNTNSGNHEESIANTSNMDLQKETQHKDHLGVSVKWRFSGDWVSEGGRPMVCRKGCLSGINEPEAGYENMKSN